TGRHRLPHRACELLFPPAAGWRHPGLASRRPRAEGSGAHLQMNASPTPGADVLARLADTLASRRPENGGDPATSYTARLLSKGPDAFLKKIGEEATELVMAAKDGHPDRIVAETADLW